MRRIAYHILIAIAGFSLLFFTGCKTTGKVATVELTAAKAHGDFFDAMQDQAFHFNTLSARLNADITAPDNELSSRVDLKIVRDSALQISVQPFLGVEVFRMEMTVDSILVLDRMNKRFIVDSFDNLKGQAPLDFNFYNLQSLFINRIFLPGEKNIERNQYDRFMLKQDGAMAEVYTKDKTGLQYTFIADGEEKLLYTYMTDESNRYALQWAYKDFRIHENQPFPSIMDIELWVDAAFLGGMKINFNRIQTDVPVSIGLTAPDKYKRVTFAQLLEPFKKKKK